MTWSKTSIPMSLPASTSRLVRSRSSMEGSRLPLGWLWTMRIEAQFLTIAVLKHSLGCTRLALSVPTLTTSRPTIWFWVLRRNTQKCSFLLLLKLPHRSNTWNGLNIESLTAFTVRLSAMYCWALGPGLAFTACRELIVDVDLVVHRTPSLLTCLGGKIGSFGGQRDQNRFMADGR